VCDNLYKMVPRPPLLVVQVYGEKVSSKDHKFEPPSVRTLYTCRSVAGQLQVRKSVRYITYNSYAISVVPPFNNYLYNNIYCKQNCKYISVIHKIIQSAKLVNTVKK